MNSDPLQSLAIERIKVYFIIHHDVPLETERKILCHYEELCTPYPLQSRKISVTINWNNQQGKNCSWTQKVDFQSF